MLLIPVQRANFQGAVPRGLKPMPTHEQACDWAPDGAGRDQADHVRCQSQFLRLRNAEVVNEVIGPGQGGAHASCQGNRSHHQPGARIQAEGACHLHPGQVLQHHEPDGQPRQDQQGPSTMAQRAGVGTQANGRKEVQQQRVTRFEIETDDDPRTVVQGEDNQGAGQAAHQGFRDAVSTQDAPTRNQALAHEQQQDGERESMEGIDRHRAFSLSRQDSAWLAAIHSSLVGSTATVT